jgi:hypothetical protein
MDQCWAIAGDRRVPGFRAETGLLQTGGKSRQVLAQIPGQACVGGRHGNVYVAGALRHAHFHAALSRPGDLELDVVRRHRPDHLVSGVGWWTDILGRRFRGARARGGIGCSGWPHIRRTQRSCRQTFGGAVHWIGGTHFRRSPPALVFIFLTWRDGGSHRRGP